MLKTKKFKIQYVFIFLAIIIASIPVFGFTKLFNINDTFSWIKKIDGLVETLDSGKLIFRINPVQNLSYGGAEPIFYPYLFLYVLYFLYKITNDYNISWNIFFIFINILSSFVMYYSVQKLFNNHKISTLATIINLLSYMRIRSIFASFCIGENLAIIFIPLVVEGYANIMKGKYDSWVDLFIGYFFILQSHIITSFYTGVLIIIVSFALLPYILKNKQILFSLLKTLIFLVIINLWYYVPFIEYYLSGKIVFPEVSNQVALASKLSFIDAVVLSGKIFLHSIHYDLYDFTYDRISYMTCFMILFLIIYFIYFRIKNKKMKLDFNKTLLLILGIIITINLLVSTGIFTRTFFGRIPFIQKFFNLQQFEYRELKRGLPLICIVFSYIFVSKINFKYKNITYILMVIIMIIPLVGLYGFINDNLIKTDKCSDFTNGDYIIKKCLPGHIMEEIKVKNNYSLPKDIFDGKIKTSSNIVLKNEKKKYLGYDIDYEKIDNNEGYIVFPLFNYDGYEAMKKNKKLKIVSGDNSLIKINIKDEKGHIDLHYKEQWLIYDIISIIGVIGFCIVVFLSKRKRFVYEN